MTQFLTSVLLSMSYMLGIQSYPDPNNDWVPKVLWENKGDATIFEASSTVIAQKCKLNPDYVLQLPQVIHGVHEIRADEKLIFRSGSSNFKIASSFYDRPYLSCNILLGSTKIDWKIYGYSKYFSRFSSYPEIRSKPKFGILFDLDFNIIATGTLIFFCIFSYYLFINRINNDLVYSLILGALFFAIYFMMCVSPKFGIYASMLNTHKIADISLFIGIYFYFEIFYKFGFLTLKNLQIYRTVSIINCLIIIFGQTGDVVQFGTSTNLPFVMFSLVVSFYSSIKLALKEKSNKIAWLSASSILMFVLTSTSDILHIFGLFDSYMISSIGVISGVFLLALSANQQIENTYKERDSLLLSLESKVQEKTKDLNHALENLKHSQAELIQSAKLASLGTLSAGIAHEINNSINFVNGAIIPLEKKVIKYIPEGEKEMINKLFTVIKHGTDLTVQIVRSLRNFTGLNQATFREINVVEVVNSVTTILRSKLNSIKLNINIENGLNFEGSQVGVSQALMNIISNSIDALPEKNPEISIEGKTCNDSIELKITDNGSGIPKELINRVFDPFFTTKQVGKGTGLGLFIVKKEVDRHNGVIIIESEPNQGTTFKLNFPIKNKSLESSMNSEAA